MKTNKKIVMTIAGSDPSGGAGIQADLKTFTALDLHGVTVITCVTAQNTQSVKAIHKIPVKLIENVVIGKTVACLANNHILDGGEIGIEETRMAFEENDIYHLGSGSNVSDACQPLLLDVKGVKIGLLAYNLFNESVFSAKNDSSGAASCIECNVTGSIHSLKEKSDVVMVMFHWGNSWTQKVSESQILKADQMFNAGADIVVGHHPHMLQAVRANESRLTIFSLGNFIFRPDYSMPSTAHKSVVAFIEIEDKKVRKCYFHPVKLDGYGIPRILTGAESELILRNLADLSEEFNTKIEIDDGVGIIHMS